MVLLKWNPHLTVREAVRAGVRLCLVTLSVVHLAGCSDEVTLSSPEGLAQFEQAGPALPPVTIDRLTMARMHESPLPGDVLEITMPVILQIVTTDEPSPLRADAPYLCRVSETGTITLPAVGEITVINKTLAQIESAIIEAYHPTYTQTRPSVFVRLAQEQGLEQPLFTVLGLVNRPGNFPYPPRIRYTLMQALGFAGGLDRTVDPRFATVYRLASDGTIVRQTFAVADVQETATLLETLNTLIKPGDIVVVEHTPRTRTKEFLDRAFRINLGTYWSLRSPWED